MKTINLTIFILFLSLGCTQNNPTVNSEGKNCFSNDPIHEYSWLRNAVDFYTQPKAGPTRVAVYIYKNDYYVAVENPSMNGPAGYIFNCNGKNIGELGVGYNDFYDSAKLIKILLKGTY